MNEKWVLDRAADYFTVTRLAKLSSDIEACLENNDAKGAVDFRDAFKPISFSSRAWQNPFSLQSIRDTIESNERNRPLLNFRGPLGKFLSEHFERGSFIAFAAPEKKGKSFWLQEVVWTALNQRRKVLYYVLGDMSERQVYRRLYSRMTLKPKTSRKEIIWPVKIRISNKDEAGRPIGAILSESRKVEAYTETDVKQALKRLRTNCAMSANPLRLRCAGAGEISMSDIESEVGRLASEGFVPDLVVIDYLDLLATEPGAGKLDFRHQIDATWKAGRRISLHFNNLVIGATQASARSYDHWLIKKGDFSEDKRKNAHVTGMVGINQTSNEKEKGIYRLNWVFLRDGEWADTQYVWTAGNLSLGCPCITSLLKVD